ncbi:DNA polymerase III subunit beta [Erysipelatoclostridium sp. An173]|uniref:DNA polymerase III subunit beta n=1 Tax=Erysipelatoclostridium sp. An173 TaxID=1965571 RepID=UPI003207C7B5
MKVKLSTKTFVKELDKVNLAIDAMVPLPALKSIKMTVDEDSITLLSSNTDITIQSVYESDDLEVIETGEVLVPALIFSNIIKKLNDENITVTMEGTVLTVKGKKSKYQVNTIRVDDYPNIDISNDGTAFDIDSKLLSSILGETSYAVSKSEIKPILTGVNLVYSKPNKRLITAATDGYRLAKIKTDITSDGDDFNIIIPEKAVKKVLKIIKNLDDDKNFKMTVSLKKVSIQTGNILIIFRLVDGSYPDTNRLVPNSFNTVVEVDKGSLIESIKRVSLIANDQNENYVKITLKNNTLILETRTLEVGNAQDFISDVKVSGKEKEFEETFSVRFILDALANISSDGTVHLYRVGALKPYVFNAPEKKGIHLILPVRAH